MNRVLTTVHPSPLSDKIEFMAGMLGMSTEEFVNSAVEHHIKSRAALPEFGQQVERHLDDCRKVSTSLLAIHRGQRNEREQ